MTVPGSMAPPSVAKPLARCYTYAMLQDRARAYRDRPLAAKSSWWALDF
jgi:hypothetical protein